VRGFGPAAFQIFRELLVTVSEAGAARTKRESAYPLYLDTLEDAHRRLGAATNVRGSTGDGLYGRMLPNNDAIYFVCEDNSPLLVS